MKFIYMVAYDTSTTNDVELAFKHATIYAKDEDEAYVLGGRRFDEDPEVRGKMLNDYVVDVTPDYPDDPT